MKTITFKLSDDEARLLRSKARRSKLTLSEYLRRHVTRAPATPPLVKLKKCPISGIKIFASEPGVPPLTTESVREMLADFP